MPLRRRPKPSPPSRPAAESQFARALHAAADTPDESHLRGAIDAGAVLLDIVPPDDQAYALALLNVSSVYGGLWRLLRDAATARAWGTYVDERASRVEPSEWRRVVAAHVFARLLTDRALTTGEAEHRDEAIEALTRARSLSWDPEVDSACLASLAQLQLIRFSDSHDPVDLELAIRDGFEAATGEDAPQAARQQAQGTVARGLQLRAEATGSTDDLTVAIHLAETLLAEMGTSYPGFQGAVRDLVAALLRRRFQYNGDHDDLNRAVSVRLQLLQESVDDDDRALQLVPLALAGGPFRAENRAAAVG